MYWTDYFDEFKQTMFEFEDNELAHADELVKAVVKMLMEKTSAQIQSDDSADPAEAEAVCGV